MVNCNQTGEAAGEAAGVAAGVALHGDKAVDQIDTEQLRKTLCDLGAVII
jgi:hypothetical protein